jgi:hypothetical protein
VRGEVQTGGDGRPAGKDKIPEWLQDESSDVDLRSRIFHILRCNAPEILASIDRELQDPHRTNS